MAPVVGVLALAANYVLLDMWKWGLMPQYQPARIVLFTTLSAIVASSIASARARSVLESIAWLVIPFAVIIRMQPLQSFERVAGTLIIGLAIACALSLRMPLTSFTPATVIVAAMYLIPGWGGAYLLPNLIGIENALEVVISNPLKQNRMLKPQQAFELGAAGIGATVYWGAPESRRQLQEIAARRHQRGQVDHRRVPLGGGPEVLVPPVGDLHRSAGRLRQQHGVAGDH